MVLECDKKYPRFHAFLKVISCFTVVIALLTNCMLQKCESKIECKRETLAQLLIRPVQRLPSMQLLLKGK